MQLPSLKKPDDNSIFSFEQGSISAANLPTRMTACRTDE
jgi:hypothetical protein